MLREMVRRRKLRFFGHVIRRKGLERTIITGKVNEKSMAQGHQELYRDDTARML